jgi:hypothetical protein
MDGLKVSVEGEGDAAAKPAPAPPAPKAAPAVTVIDERNASVVDARGRLIKVRKLGAVDRMRLFKVAGPDGSQIDRYMGYAFLGASATEVDGVPMPFPTTSLILDTHVGRLEEDGLAAVAKALAALNPEQEDLAAAARGL